MDFDLIASEYARHRKIMLPVLDGLRDFVAAIGHKAAVVELGSGTGNYIIALAESTGCMAWGIDCAKGMLAQAVSRGSEVQFAIVERIGHTVRVTNAAAYAAKAYSALNFISGKAFERGLRRLEADLATGPIHGTRRALMLLGTKR